MTNSMMLRQTIKDTGLKISAVMDALGIKSYTTMREKLDNVKSFTVNEMGILCTLLKLTQEQREQIFFAYNTELNSVNKTKGA